MWLETPNLLRKKDHRKSVSCLCILVLRHIGLLIVDSDRVSVIVLTISGERLTFSSLPLSVRALTVRLRDAIQGYENFLAWRYLSALSGRILTKLCINIHHASRHCWKRFSKSEVNGQDRNETKCTFLAEASFRRCGVEAQLVVENSRWWPRTRSGYNSAS